MPLYVMFQTRRITLNCKPNVEACKAEALRTIRFRKWIFAHNWPQAQRWLQMIDKNAQRQCKGGTGGLRVLSLALWRKIRHRQSGCPTSCPNLLSDTQYLIYDWVAKVAVFIIRSGNKDWQIRYRVLACKFPEDGQGLHLWHRAQDVRSK